MKHTSCPQCGSEITLHSRLAKLVSCNHCGSTLLIEPTGLSQSDIESHIQAKLSLLKQGGSFIWREQQFFPQGFIQLKHNQGYRKEWWVLDKQKNSYWLSEEDENFFLLQDLVMDDVAMDKKDIPPWLSLQVNTQLSSNNKNWLVTEKRMHNYSGFQGQIPDLPNQEETLYYTYLTGENAESLVLIFENNQIRSRQGYWLDPFEIKAAL